MTTKFKVEGPFPLKVIRGAGGKDITTENISRFWQETGRIKGQRGCYVLG
jgi:hypothetical protein